MSKKFGLHLAFSEVDHTYMERLKCGAGEGWRRSVGLIV